MRRDEAIAELERRRAARAAHEAQMALEAQNAEQFAEPELDLSLLENRADYTTPQFNQENKVPFSMYPQIAKQALHNIYNGPLQEPRNWDEALVGQAERAISNVTHGITAPFLESLPESTGIPQGSRDVAFRRKMLQEMTKENFPKSALTGEITGDLLAIAPLIASAPQATPGLLGLMIESGLLTGELESLKYGDLKDRAARTAEGLLAGAATPVITKGLGKAIEAPIWLTNAIRGPGKEGQELIRMAEKEGVPIVNTDFSEPGSIGSMMANYVEKIPGFGTLKTRAAQRDALQVASERVKAIYGESLDKVGYGKNVIEMIERAAASGGKRAKEAQRLLENINNSDSEWYEILKTSGSANLFRKKLVADELYNQVAVLADKAGNIDTAPIIKKFDNILKILNKNPVVNENEIAFFTKLKEDFLGKKPGSAASSLVDAAGKPLIPASGEQTVLTPKNYTDLREYRTTINDKINDYYTGKNSLIGKKGVGYLQNISNTIENTMNNFARQGGGELAEAAQVANNYYQKQLTPFKHKQLAAALNKEADADKIFDTFIKEFQGKGDYKTSGALRLYNALGEKGKAAVRYGLVRNAAATAVDPITNKFSPAKFATYIGKMDPNIELFFNKTDKAYLKGLANLMRHMEKAGQSKIPETGALAVPLMIFGGAGYGGTKMLMQKFGLNLPEAMASVGAAGWGVQKLLTTKAGRNLLMASSNVHPNSPQWNKLIGRLSDLLAPDLQEVGKVLSMAKGEEAIKSMMQLNNGEE